MLVLELIIANLKQENDAGDELGMRIHKYLAGDQDYVDSNIVLNHTEKPGMVTVMLDAAALPAEKIEQTAQEIVCMFHDKESDHE